MKKLFNSKSARITIAMLMVIAMVAAFIPMALAEDEIDGNPVELVGLDEGQMIENLFPDANFCAWIKTNVLKNKYNEAVGLSEADILAITGYKQMSVQDAGVISIEGIGYFESLTVLSVNSKATKSGGDKVNVLQSIPEELYTLKDLFNLNLNYNAIYEIPEGLSELTNLTNIGFAYNEISEFPEEIGYMKQLTNINFSSNRIDELPDVFGDLTNVQAFTIASNQIETLPESLWSMTSLIQLALANNKITSIKGVENLTKLTTFTIAYNQVTDISGLNMAGMGKAFSTRQAAGHISFESPIIVEAGATSATIDINDYEFIYNSVTEGVLAKDPFVRVYLNIPQSEAGYSDAYRNYEANGGYWSYEYYTYPALQAYTKDSIVIDRNSEDTTVTIEFDADATSYILRIGNHDHSTEMPGGVQWTSFWNFDVSYVIPIERYSPVVYDVTGQNVSVLVNNTIDTPHQGYADKVAITPEMAIADGYAYRFYARDGEVNYSVNEITGVVTGLIVSNNNPMDIYLVQVDEEGNVIGEPLAATTVNVTVYNVTTPFPDPIIPVEPNEPEENTTIEEGPPILAEAEPEPEPEVEPQPEPEPEEEEEFVEEVPLAEAPATGDAATMMIAAILALLAISGIALVIFTAKKRVN